MFSSSSQKNHWMFLGPDGPQRIAEARANTYAETVSIFPPELAQHPNLITVEDERRICQFIEETALSFCQAFQPTMPVCVIWTAFAYQKRFYLKHSVIEYLPRPIMMTSLYLACKVEEFNVTIDDFVRNLKSGTRESNTEQILSLELELMTSLDYELIVHSPFRALEGFLIDLKTRGTAIENPERLRSGANQLLWKAMLSDVLLLYAPSKIALASLRYAATELGESVDGFIGSVLLGSVTGDEMNAFLSTLDRIVADICGVIPVNKEEREGEGLMQKLKFTMLEAEKCTSAKRPKKEDEDSAEDD